MVLVNVRLRETKGVFDQIEGRPALLENDFHDVEAEEDVGVVEHPQPGEGTAGDELLLFAVDRFARRAVAETAAGFDFDEDQRVAGFVAADEIDFAAVRCAVVAVEDLEAAAPQVALGEALPLAPQPLVLVFAGLRRAGEASGERGKKISDESDKAHARGA